jgi:hypothetical protein
MMEAIYSSETSVLTRATRHHIPEDGSFQYMQLLQNLVEVLFAINRYKATFFESQIKR